MEVLSARSRLQGSLQWESSHTTSSVKAARSQSKNVNVLALKKKKNPNSYYHDLVCKQLGNLFHKEPLKALIVNVCFLLGHRLRFVYSFLLLLFLVKNCNTMSKSENASSL